jgi:very-short-patch-repair endonuclease
MSRRRKTNEFFLKEVADLTGEKYEFLEEYITALTKIRVKHKKCGNTYEVRPDSFFSGRRCPYCKSSKGEKEIAKRLKKRHIKFLTEKTFAGLKDNISLRFDFYLPDFNLVIEYDGRQHFEPVTFGGVSEEKAKENFIKAKKRDCIKNNYCKENGIRLIRISFSEFENIGEILDKELLSLRG